MRSILTLLAILAGTLAGVFVLTVTFFVAGLLVSTDTEYAPGFTWRKFNAIPVGATTEEVTALLGEPFPLPGWNVGGINRLTFEEGISSLTLDTNMAGSRDLCTGSTASTGIPQTPPRSVRHHSKSNTAYLNAWKDQTTTNTGVTPAHHPPPTIGRLDSS